MDSILNDFIAEQAVVDSLVSDLNDDQWGTRLGWCSPWTVKDAVIHLAFFDHAANVLIDGKGRDLMQISDDEAQMDADFRAQAFQHLAGDEVLLWWREERTKLNYKFLNIAPKERIPWAPGFPMSAKSLCTSRFMELWAHSVDILDALSKNVVVKDRIANVLFLAWQTRAYAYNLNGIELPETPVYLSLTLPSSKLWIIGDEAAENRIAGSARDWALVSIRRRNWMDTGLEVIGDEARRYASISQTYALLGDAPPKAKNPR